MRTNIINKHAIKLIFAVLLVVAVVVTSVVSAYFMISTKSDIILGGDNNIDGIAPTETSSKVDKAPNKDGEVPGGSETFKQRYVSNSDWIAITNQDQMRDWLANNNNKNAYLANNISYESSMGAGKAYAARAAASGMDAISVGRIFDGCGYTVTLTGNQGSETDAWQDKQYDGRYLYSLFVAHNAGTMRNVVFSYVGKTIYAKDNGKCNVAAGLAVAYNTGSVYNIYFDFGSQFEYIKYAYDSYSFVGIINGSNRGTMSNCTVNGRSGSKIRTVANAQWDHKMGYAYAGALIGESRNGNEYNNTLISEGVIVEADGYNDDAAGACIGEKIDGNTHGFLLIGATKVEKAGYVGVVAGRTSGSVSVSGIYSDYSAGFGDTQVIGNGESAWQKTMTQVYPSQYDVVFDKSEKYFESNANIPDNIIITPKTGTTGSQRPSIDNIIWGVQYKNTSGASLTDFEIKDLAQELITGSIRIPNVFPRQRTSLNVVYGTYGAVESYEIAVKEYNGEGQSASTDTVVYSSPTGVKKSVYLTDPTMKILYDGASDLPFNAKEYAVNASGYYVDNNDKFYGYNPNSVFGTLTIEPKNIIFNIDNFTLSNYSKVYDESKNAPTALPNLYPTGIHSDKLLFILSGTQYSDKNVGIDKQLTFSVSFILTASATNMNYTVNGDSTFKGLFTVNRGIITAAPLTLPSDMISIDLLTKQYDKTDTYNGQVTVKDSFKTQYGEDVSIENVVAKYNNKNVSADKIVATFGLKSDDISSNYALTASHKEFIGASITPCNMAVNWTTFAQEAFYNVDGSSKISRIYDTTNTIGGDLLAVKKPFTTELGEILKLKYVSGTLNNKNVGNNKTLTFTFAFDELATGSIDLGGEVYVMADYRNYVLDNTSVDTTATVSPKEITVIDSMFNATLSKAYDGTINYVGDTITQNVISGVGDETINIGNISAVYNTKDVGADKLVLNFTKSDNNYSFNITPNDNTYSYALSGASILPYNFTITENMFHVVTTKIYDATTDYIGTITQKDIKVTLTGGEESITLNNITGVYLNANVKGANNGITIAYNQGNTNFAINESIIVAASITAHTLTLSANDFEYATSKIYDGTTTDTISVKTILGLANQEISLSSVTANFNSKDVVSANAITIDFALADNDINGNYILSAQTLNIASSESHPIAITTKLLTISATDFAEFAKTKVYDGTDVFNGNIAAIDFATGVLDETVGIIATSAKFNTANVATGDIIRIIAQIAQSNTNYAINASVEFNAAITPKSVVVGADIFTYDNVKTYNALTDYIGKPITASTIKTGITVNEIEEELTLLIGAATYNSKNVSNANKINLLISQNNGNYTIVNNIDLAASIKPYTVSDDMRDMARYTLTTEKVFDGSNVAEITINNGYATITGLAGETFTYKATAKYATTDIGVGIAISITVESLDGNYKLNILTFQGSADGKITAAALTITINDFDFDKVKEYDGKTDVLINDYTILGIAGEEVALKDGYHAEYNDKTVGKGKTITITFAPADDGYTFTNTTVEFIAGEGENCEITKRKVTLDSEDFNYLQDKIYDGTINYNNIDNPITVKDNGAVATGVDSDTISVTTSGTPEFNSANVGKDNFIGVGVEMTEHINYYIDSSVKLAANISSKIVTITANDLKFDKSRVYNGNDKVSVSADAIATNVGIETITLVNLSAEYNNKNVLEANKITITFSQDNANYTLASEAIVIDGEDVKITPYAIQSSQVNANIVKSKIYDGNFDVTVNTVEIIVGTGEGLTATSIAAIYDNKNVGTARNITLTFVVNDANYSLSFIGIEFTDGVIIQKAITIADADITAVTSKVYDGTIDYVGNAVTHGVINGACGSDVITLVFGAVEYNSKNVKEANALIINFTQADGNYVLANTSLSKIATITAYVITVSESDFIFDRTKVYDNSNNVAVVSGVINGIIGETVRLINVSGAYNSKDVATANAIALSFALDESYTNYSLTMASIGVSGATVEITRFVLTNDHVDFSYSAKKTYDGTENANGVTYTINSEKVGFVDDALTITISSALYANKNVGESKEVNFVYATSNTNYMFSEDKTSQTKTYDDGIIDRATIVPSADEFTVVKSSQYSGGNSSELSTTATVKGVNGETIAIAVSATYFTGDDFNVGKGKTIRVDFAMTQLDSNDNYTLGTVFIEINDCEITPKQITVTANDFNITASKVYDATLKANVTAKDIAGVLDEIVTIHLDSAMFNSANVVGAKNITITFSLPSNVVNANYIIANLACEITYADGVAITPAKLIVDYTNTEQSYRNNPNPLSKVVVSIVSGAVGQEAPSLQLLSVDIAPNQPGNYTLEAVTPDTNYAVANTATLILDVFARANGTWLIENLKDFNYINTDARYLTYNFTQTANIDLHYGTLVGIKGDFTGIYNGNNFMIMNAFLYGAPLFETLSGSVTNLAVANMVVISYTDAKIGGIAGVVSASGVIENVVFEGSIYIANSGSETVYVGGIAAENNGRISSVKVLADITVKADSSYVGGIVGYNKGIINAISISGVKDLNNVVVEIIASGQSSNVDAVAAFNDATLDASDTLYQSNANVKVAADDTYSVVNSNLGSGLTFKDIAGINTVMFGDMSVIDFINAYRNDSNLKLTSSYVIVINNFRDFAMIGRYNYLDVVFNSSFVFHQYYEHTAFNKLQIGSITLKGDVVLDARIGNVDNIFKYHAIG